VGVGTVTGDVTPVSEFMVETNEGPKPILEVPHKAEEMGKRSDEPDFSEYMVPVEWIKTLPREKAYREKGMYANQNTVTKLRNRFTLERLVKYFDLDEE
jgi:hypothetical protein